MPPLKTFIQMPSLWFLHTIYPSHLNLSFICPDSNFTMQTVHLYCSYFLLFRTYIYFGLTSKHQHFMHASFTLFLPFERAFTVPSIFLPCITLFFNSSFPSSILNKLYSQIFILDYNFWFITMHISQSDFPTLLKSNILLLITFIFSIPLQ